MVAALLPPYMPLAAAKFKIGDKVHSKPDSMPGLHPTHAVAVYGHICECRGVGIWEYKIQANDDARHITSK